MIKISKKRESSQIICIIKNNVILNMFQNLCCVLNPLSLWEREEFLGERSELRNSGEGFKSSPHPNLPHPGKELFPRPAGEGRVRGQAAFTLTEVLLAIVIVGVIAALVLPAVVTHFQEKGFDQAYVRETKTIESAIQGLAVNENKSSFFDTMMYTSEEPESYEDNAELFLKKYLRVSKICGDNNKDCFGGKYYQYKDNDKKIYSPEFKGSCASLKNGASICITPQVGAAPITGIIDLNGQKGPNVFGKDLRKFSFSSITQAGRNIEVAAVLDTEFSPIVTDDGGGGDEPDPCEGKTCGCGTLPPCDPCAGKTCGCGSLPDCETECSSNPVEWDKTCCEKNKSSITSYKHNCCSYTSINNSVNACREREATIDFVCYIYKDGTNFCHKTGAPFPLNDKVVGQITYYLEDGTTHSESMEHYGDYNLNCNSSCCIKTAQITVTTFEGSAQIPDSWRAGCAVVTDYSKPYRARCNFNYYINLDDSITYDAGSFTCYSF